MAFDTKESVGQAQQRFIVEPVARDGGAAADVGSGSATSVIEHERATTEQATRDLRRPTLLHSIGAWLSLLVALILATLGLLRLREWLRCRLDRFRIEERRRERAHVARMLHDTLLQGTQGFIFLAQAAANRMSSDDPAKALLERALLRADASLLEGRIRLQDLRDSAHTSADPSLLLRSIGEDLAGEQPERFRVKVTGIARAMRPFAADAAFLIGREALVNAFSHSHAKAVELKIHYGDQHLVVCICDDGCGIEPDILTQGGSTGRWGLRGMSERAASIPAQLRIRRPDEHGTEVELRIDARSAYLPQLNPRRHLPGWAVLHVWWRSTLKSSRRGVGAQAAAGRPSARSATYTDSVHM